MAHVAPPPERWWRPPRLRSNEPEAHRKATWLELFYDLVYVAVVAALAHELSAHLSWEGLLAFAGLFVPVWWSWSGVTLYNDRFDTDDASHRVFTLLQMMGAVAMALSVHDALHGPGFAVSYAAVRLVLVAKYLRAARHVPSAEGLARRYALGFSLAAALWLASLLLPVPLRYGLWAVAMAVDVGTPLTARRLQARLPVSPSHLPERIGLFTIIVLGEAVAATVRGAEGAGVTARGMAAGLLVMALAFCVWWVYFDNLDERLVRRTRVAAQTWFYTHLLLAMGITAMAVGAEHLVRLAAGEPFQGAERWLLGGAFALVLAALGVLHLATVEERGLPRNRRRALLRMGSAALVLALTASGGILPGFAFGALLAGVAVAQVVLDPPTVHPAVAS